MTLESDARAEAKKALGDYDRYFADRLLDPAEVTRLAEALRALLAGAARTPSGDEPRIDDSTDDAWQAIADALGNLGYDLTSHEDTADWVQSYLFHHPAPSGDEQCSYCGESSPRPVELHHSEEECTPIGDEREALAQAIRDALGVTPETTAAGHLRVGNSEDLADAVLAAGFHRDAPTAPNDETVQRVREAVFAQSQRDRRNSGGESYLYYPSIGAAEVIAHAALTAAYAVRRGER